MRKFILLSCLVLAACQAPGPIRDLNNQNIEAAALIESTTTDPTIKQAAKDIRQNAQQVQGHLGPAENPKDYSPENSAQARDAAGKVGAWYNPVNWGSFEWITGLIMSYFGLKGGGSLVSTILSLLKSGKNEVALQNVLDKVKEKENGDGKITIAPDDLKRMIFEETQKMGVVEHNNKVYQARTA